VMVMMVPAHSSSLIHVAGLFHWRKPEVTIGSGLLI
jgi:hypothetical protein